MPTVTRRSTTTRSRSHASARLTDREVEYLVAWIDGGTKGAAFRLNRSEQTVKHALANARAKCGATSTAQLVELAIGRVQEHRRVAQKRP